MGTIQPYQDTSGKLTSDQVNAKNIEIVMNEFNRGTDTTSISRRTILAGQIKVFKYLPSPFSIRTDNSGNPLTIAAGQYFALILDFINPAQTTQVGQTFLPIMYVDLFIDPPDASSTSNLYNNSGSYLYPDGSNVTSGMAKVNFNSYLRNSTPLGNNNIVSYVYSINNQDSAAHYYWISVSLLFPADGNLASGNTGVYLP